MQNTFLNLNTPNGIHTYIHTQEQECQIHESNEFQLFRQLLLKLKNYYFYWIWITERFVCRNSPKKQKFLGRIESKSTARVLIVHLVSLTPSAFFVPFLILNYGIPTSQHFCFIFFHLFLSFIFVSQTQKDNRFELHSLRNFGNKVVITTRTTEKAVTYFVIFA